MRWPVLMVVPCGWKYWIERITVTPTCTLLTANTSSYCHSSGIHTRLLPGGVNHPDDTMLKSIIFCQNRDSS